MSLFFQAGTVPGATTSFGPLLPLNIRPIPALRTLPRSFAVSPKSDPESDAGVKPRRGRKPGERLGEDEAGSETVFPRRKPRRGRRSEAAAVEDFVRNRLEETFRAIREQDPALWEEKRRVLKEVAAREGEEDEEEEEEERMEAVVEEESEGWPVDAEVGWGVRASEYFEKHSIRNVVGEDGLEIDWEGEVDDPWVQEINCLEWESFAFHPSPLLVLAFQRYNQASENWKTLKELEKAAKVYWNAKDRLPPRMVKFDVNIEKDLAYALKAKECPQIFFLRGHRIIYKEKEFRMADELVQMIAHFYYGAKRPLFMKDAD